MRHVHLVTLLFSIASVCVAAEAAAQTITSPFRYIEERHTFGVFAGHLATDAGELDLGPKPAQILGARYNMRFSGPLSGDVQLSFGQTSRNVYVPAPVGSGNAPTLIGERDMTLVSALAGIRFHFTGSRSWNGIAPFATLSGGLIDDIVSVGGIDAQLQQEQRYSLGPAFAAGLGLGSDVYLTDRLAIRVEARDHLWRIRYPDAFFEDGATDGEWTHNFGLTIGGSFNL